MSAATVEQNLHTPQPHSERKVDMVGANTGLDTVWSHIHEGEKFGQFGWRSWTNECGYSTATLIGNWNEERFDIKEIQKGRTIPSDRAHYYMPTYRADYCKPQACTIPKELHYLKRRFPTCFPGHQPELDLPAIKTVYNSWETTAGVSYVDPATRFHPEGQRFSWYKPPTSEQLRARSKVGQLPPIGPDGQRVSEAVYK